MNEIDEAVPQLKFYEEVRGRGLSVGAVRGSEAAEGWSPGGGCRGEGAVPRMPDLLGRSTSQWSAWFIRGCTSCSNDCVSKGQNCPFNQVQETFKNSDVTV